jgi:uncharacterized protein (TIGR00369 family)
MTAIFERVQKSFERQGMMQHLDARLVKVEHGLVELVLPYSDKVTQQQDGFHGGAMGAVADIAGGYAALTVTPEGSEVVTVEYKINFLGSFKGGELRATGRVVKGGKTHHRDHRRGGACGRRGQDFALRRDAADPGAGAQELLKPRGTGSSVRSRMAQSPSSRLF